MKVLRAVSALMIALGIAFIGIGMASAGMAAPKTNSTAR